MAPRKPAIVGVDKQKTKKMASAKHVVKRPARGYHKFRNGLLNVTPKGGEKQLTRNNQKSPLLRLPPEIRNRIWGYAVGGNAIKSVWGGSWGPDYHLKFPKSEQLPSPEPGHLLALLRTCRQIYSETAVLPYTDNTFSLDSVRSMRYGLKRVKPHLRMHITSIQLEIDYRPRSHGFENRVYVSERFSLRACLPGLKNVHAYLYQAELLNEATMQKAKDDLLEALRFQIPDMTVELKVEVTDQKFPLDYKTPVVSQWQPEPSPV